MFSWIKRFWVWLNEPSKYDIWSKAFDRLQVEKKLNGISREYWKIWYKEVCPAYRILTESVPKFLRHPSTDGVLHDMDKQLSQRKYY